MAKEMPTISISLDGFEGEGVSMSSTGSAMHPSFTLGSRSSTRSHARPTRHGTGRRTKGQQG